MMKFLNVHSIYIVFMYIYTESGKIKKIKKYIQLYYFSRQRLTPLYLICRHRLIHARL